MKPDQLALLLVLIASAGASFMRLGSDDAWDTRGVKHDKFSTHARGAGGHHDNAAEGDSSHHRSGGRFYAHRSSGKVHSHDKVFEYIDCKLYPSFCDDKVDCKKNPMTIGEMAALNASIVGSSKRANVRSWCLTYPNYETTVRECVLNNNLKTNADLTFEAQVARNLDTADAVYCELAGLCQDTLLSEHSTVKDSDRVCNLRFQNRWKKIGWKEFTETVAAASTVVNSSQAEMASGKTSWMKFASYARKSSITTAMTACAMGSYHCDVFYCKRNYCGKGKYALWSQVARNSKKALEGP